MNGSGRIKVDGRIDTENTIRISDNYSMSSGGVEVGPIWSNESEEIQFRVILLGHKDDETGIELTWDGFRLMQDGKCILSR
jgi:hypothetical protein